MFVRFRKPATRVQVSVAASHRVRGKITHVHLASFGSIAEPASVHDRFEFWQSLHERLGRLGGRIDVADLAKLVAAVHDRIPMVGLEEQREVGLKKHQNIERLDQPKTANLDLESPLIRNLNSAFETAQEEKVCSVLAAAVTTGNKSRLANKGRTDRTTLYRAFQMGHHPKFVTVLKVLHSLDMRLECHSNRSGMDEELQLVLARLNEGFKTADAKTIHSAFGALISGQSKTVLADQLAMSRTSLYRWLRSGIAPTFRSIMNLTIALQLRLTVQRSS